MTDVKSKLSYKTKENIKLSQDKNLAYTIDDAIKEFDELKNIALNCFDKNGNPKINFLDIEFKNIKNIDISISHCKEYAVATVVAIVD